LLIESELTKGQENGSKWQMKERRL
jgi:hypothetical protein